MRTAGMPANIVSMVVTFDFEQDKGLEKGLSIKVKDILPGHRPVQLWMGSRMDANSASMTSGST